MQRLQTRAGVLLSDSCRRISGISRSPLNNKHNGIIPGRNLSSDATIRSRTFSSKAATSSSKTLLSRPRPQSKILQHDNPRMVDKTLAGGYSLSEAAGHISFVGVCIAYLNTDILMLRLLSMGSISLSIIFQYYRAIPLWIPIRWNTLLLGINTVMIASLLIEQQQADNMSPTLEIIYREGCFEKRGFSKVEFLRLFDKAKQVSFQRGTKLASDGEENKTLYFVTQGSIVIERKGKRIALLTCNHFIGEMSFLNHLLGDDETNPASNAGSGSGSQLNNNNTKHSSSSTTASADAVVEDDVVAYIWDFDGLKDYLGGEREVCNALSAYMNHDLRAKLASLNATTVHTK